MTSSKPNDHATPRRLAPDPCQIAESAFIAAGAVVVGDVTIGARSSVWYCAVVRGDMAPVIIGEESNIQDGSVIHVDTNRPCVIGDRVTVGHGAVLHGCRIEDNALIGIRATVLNDAQIGSGSVIGAGALIPEGTIIPNDSLVLGVPGKVVGPVRPELKARVLRGARHYVDAARVYKGQDRVGRLNVGDAPLSAECISEDLGPS